MLAEVPRVDRGRLCRETLDFLSALHGGRAGRIRFRSGFRIGRRLHGIESRDFSWPQQSDEAARWVSREASYGRDVYQAPYLATGSGRARATVVFADIDKACLDHLPAPSLVVESSPGRKQCYWSLSEAIPAAAAENLGLRIVASCGDSTRWSGPVRFMRIPGSPNFKYHQTDVRLAQAVAEVYDPAFLDEVLPPLPRAAIPEAMVDSYRGFQDRLSAALAAFMRSPSMKLARLAAAAVVAVLMTSGIGSGGQDLDAGPNVIHEAQARSASSQSGRGIIVPDSAGVAAQAELGASRAGAGTLAAAPGVSAQRLQSYTTSDGVSRTSGDTSRIVEGWWSEVMQSLPGS